jgi:tmRNA-binding protein
VSAIGLLLVPHSFFWEIEMVKVRNVLGQLARKYMHWEKRKKKFQKRTTDR